jgi:hypothetical protein
MPPAAVRGRRDMRFVEEELLIADGARISIGSFSRLENLL